MDKGKIRIGYFQRVRPGVGWRDGNCFTAVRNACSGRGHGSGGATGRSPSSVSIRNDCFGRQELVHAERGTICGGSWAADATDFSQIDDLLDQSEHYS